VSFWSCFFLSKLQVSLLWVTMGHVTLNCTFDFTTPPFWSSFCNFCIYSIVLYYFLILEKFESWQSLVTFDKSCNKVNGCGIEPSPIFTTSSANSDFIDYCSERTMLNYMMFMYLSLKHAFLGTHRQTPSFLLLFIMYVLQRPWTMWYSPHLKYIVILQTKVKMKKTTQKTNTNLFE